MSPAPIVPVHAGSCVRTGDTSVIWIEGSTLYCWRVCFPFTLGLLLDRGV